MVMDSSRKVKMKGLSPNADRSLQTTQKSAQEGPFCNIQNVERRRAWRYLRQMMNSFIYLFYCILFLTQRMNS